MDLGHVDVTTDMGVRKSDGTLGLPDGGDVDGSRLPGGAGSAGGKLHNNRPGTARTSLVRCAGDAVPHALGCASTASDFSSSRACRAGRCSGAGCW